MSETDFTVWRGADLLEKPYFDVLKRHDAVYLPTFYARAVPGGPGSRETYQSFKAECLAALKAALPLDGIYLAMHGAVFVAGMEDAEADWLRATRELFGPDCLIAVRYDLYGNLSQAIIDQIDIFSTYRTAPHIDVFETRCRSVGMLFRALETGMRPHVSWVPVPVVLPGGRTSTEDEPASRQAVVAIEGVTLVLSARRRPYHDIADFAALGIDPKAAVILVVKSGYLSPELAPIANPSLMMLSPGVVDQDVARLPRLRKAHRTYPFDTGFDWVPQARPSARRSQSGKT